MSNKNLHDLLYLAQERFGARPALRQKIRGQWQTWTWSDYYQKVSTLGRGLLALGVEPGDRIGVLAYSRREWVVADQAIMCLGCITIPIYQSNTPAECEFILNNSGARFLFVEDENQLAKVRKTRDQLPDLEKIIVFDDGFEAASESEIAWDDLMEKGEAEEETGWEERTAQPGKEALATFVYTSGTTGPPKGAMLTHGNFLSMINSLKDTLPLGPDDETLLFLPLAHIFARILTFTQIERGYAITFAESIDKVAENLPEVRPTFMASVPRIFEKIYAKINAGAKESGGMKLKIFNWSMSVGGEVSKLRQQGVEPTGLMAMKLKLANRLVFEKIAQRVFGGRVKFFLSGGAPLSKEIAEFFHAMDMAVLEGYGLTETSGVLTINRLDRFRLGAVGLAVPGVEIKIADDGEILARGGNIMQGYYKNEEATAEALDAEHWFHTGDIGEVRDGFLAITDRKKDLIITAGGKNIAPQNIENLMKNDPYISQAMVIGDRKPYLVALITLDAEAIAGWVREKGLQADPDHYFESPEIIKHMEARVAESNAKMAGFEQIKKFAILPGDFSQETGELTPTLKVKRKFCAEKFKDNILKLYGN